MERTSNDIDLEKAKQLPLCELEIKIKYQQSLKESIWIAELYNKLFFNFDEYMEKCNQLINGEATPYDKLLFIVHDVAQKHEKSLIGYNALVKSIGSNEKKLYSKEKVFAMTLEDAVHNLIETKHFLNINTTAELVLSLPRPSLIRKGPLYAVQSTNELPGGISKKVKKTKPAKK